MLCHDLSGAMVDLESKEWVHHVCVNWHNEIWFEEDDNKIRSFGGTLDFERFNLKCTICQEQHGSCIECDISTCRTPFHVRCAIKEGLILSEEEMTSKQKLKDWDIKIFCKKHTKLGKHKVEKIKR